MGLCGSEKMCARQVSVGFERAGARILLIAFVSVFIKVSIILFAFCIFIFVYIALCERSEDNVAVDGGVAQCYDANSDGQMEDEFSVKNNTTRLGECTADHDWNMNANTNQWLFFRSHRRGVRALNQPSETPMVFFVSGNVVALTKYSRIFEDSCNL